MHHFKGSIVIFKIILNMNWKKMPECSELRSGGRGTRLFKRK